MNKRLIITVTALLLSNHSIESKASNRNDVDAHSSIQNRLKKNPIEVTNHTTMNNNLNFHSVKILQHQVSPENFTRELSTKNTIIMPIITLLLLNKSNTYKVPQI